LFKHSILLSKPPLSMFPEYLYIHFTIFFNESWISLHPVCDSFCATVMPQMAFWTYPCFAKMWRRATLDVTEKLLHFVRQLRFLSVFTDVSVLCIISFFSPSLS